MTKNATDGRGGIEEPSRPLYEIRTYWKDVTGHICIDSEATIKVLYGGSFTVRKVSQPVEILGFIGPHSVLPVLVATTGW